MNFAPLLNASAIIQIHTAAALLSAVCGLLVLLRAKGTHWHRMAGYVFVVAMFVTAITSFWITGIRPGQFSAIHILSIVTIVSISAAIYHRRRGNIRGHAMSMISPLIGLIIAGAFTLSPGRIMHSVFFGP